MATSLPWFPVAFRPPAFASWSSFPAREFGLPYGQPTDHLHEADRTLSGFPRSAPVRYDRGGCPPVPRGRWCPPGRRARSPTGTRRFTSGQSLHPAGTLPSGRAQPDEASTEVHSRSPVRSSPCLWLPDGSGALGRFLRASHPAVTSDACRSGDRSLDTDPEHTYGPTAAPPSWCIHCTSATSCRTRSLMLSASASRPPMIDVSFGVGFAAPDFTNSLVNAHMLVQQLRQPGLLGQFQHRHQPGARHQIHVIEHGDTTVPPMRQFHRKCPSDPALMTSSANPSLQVKGHFRHFTRRHQARRSADPGLGDALPSELLTSPQDFIADRRQPRVREFMAMSEHRPVRRPPTPRTPAEGTAF